MKMLAGIVFAACLAGISIANAEDEGEEGLKRTEVEFHKTIEMEYGYATDACKAVIEIEYYQKGASAHVESTLTNDDCGASSGSGWTQVLLWSKKITSWPMISTSCGSGRAS